MTTQATASPGGEYAAAFDAVWVRCAYGTFYRNPRRVVAGGFVSFPPMPQSAAHGIAAVWADAVERDPDVLVATLDDALGRGAWQIVDALGRDECVAVPGPTPAPGDPALPPRVLPAYGYTFRLLRPMPEPHYHDDFTRYPARLGKRAIVIDPGGRS